MKQYYRIKEISTMYNIGVDSLRYYEKIGLLNPKRDSNGYRLYALSDIYKLNLIRDLKSLHLPMKEIKAYLDAQDIQHTNQLIDNELSYIDQQMEELKRKYNVLAQRKKRLEYYQCIDTNHIICKEIEERRCVRLMTKLTKDEESDFAMKKLHSLYEKVLQQLLDQKVGSVIQTQEICTDVVYSSIFFILEENVQTYDFILPKGKYLSMYYRGPYHQTSTIVKELLTFADCNGYKVIKEPIELCHIDNRHTKNVEEFVSEVQILVVPKV